VTEIICFLGPWLSEDGEVMLPNVVGNVLGSGP
jgi:hypothetical protein